MTKSRLIPKSLNKNQLFKILV